MACEVLNFRGSGMLVSGKASFYFNLSCSRAVGTPGQQKNKNSNFLSEGLNCVQPNEPSGEVDTTVL
jgi:hypothetical protein